MMTDNEMNLVQKEIDPCAAYLDELNVCLHNSSFMCHKIGNKLYDCDRCKKLNKKKGKGLALSKNVGKAVDTLIHWIEPRVLRGEDPKLIEDFIVEKFSITTDKLDVYYNKIDFVRPDLSIRKLKSKSK